MLAPLRAAPRQGCFAPWGSDRGDGAKQSHRRPALACAGSLHKAEFRRHHGCQNDGDHWSMSNHHQCRPNSSTICWS